MSALCCQSCGATTLLVEHHPVGRDFAPGVLVTLCVPCHRQLHATTAGLWRPPATANISLVWALRLAATAQACGLGWVAASAQGLADLLIDRVRGQQ